MNGQPASSLKRRSVLITAGILLVVLGLNTLANIYAAAGKYREALVSRAAILAQGVTKDITKVVGFGLPLNALEGMGDKLRGLMEGDRDLSRALVMDLEGRVLYAGDRTLEETLPADPASRAAVAAAAPMVHRYADERGEHIEQVIPLHGPDGRKIGVLRIALRAEAVNRQVRSLLLWSVAVGLLSFLIATVLVSYAVERWISGPIRALSVTAGRMASGDLGRAGEVKGSTEIAHLAAAVNTMAANLREMLRRVGETSGSLSEAIKVMNTATQRMSEGARVQHESTEQTAATVNEMNASIHSVAENAESMSHAAVSASSSATEMATSIEEVARNMGELAAAVDDTASSLDETLAAIRQVSENTESLSASAEQTSSSITEMSASVREVEARARESAELAEKVLAEVSDRGMSAVREVIAGMDNIKRTVEATSDAVGRLDKRSQEIGQILKVIDEVTDQTGLLALNAAILAAQAGEHGKGFAVVAEEIKDLAERTASSTKEIADLIAAVQEETAQSVQAMTKGRQAVESGVDLAQAAGDVFGQVAESSRLAAETARAIERTTAEQTKGVSQITEASVSIASQIDRIAHAIEEQRKGNERIARAAEKIRDLSRQVKAATIEQSGGSKQIAGAIESVTAQATQAASAMFEQKQGVERISEAVKRIQGITERNMDVSVEMDMAVAALREKAAELRSELAKFKF